MAKRRFVTVEEYEKRMLFKLLKEAGVEPIPIIEKFVEKRDEYCARLISELTHIEPHVAIKVAGKLLQSPNPLDKTLGAWLASKHVENKPPSTLYA
ncbi:MAG: hypothetical protein QXY49_02585 [Thermofilaceae archaeon]